MPELSRFYGIIIKMYFNDIQQHHKPHIHALYGDEEIVVAIDGEVLEGSFPKKQMKLLVAWMAIHEDELNANWRMLSEGEGYFKIAPLN